MMEPFQLPYQNYQRGDLIIGGIVSYFGFVFEEMDFHEHPNTKLTDELFKAGSSHSQSEAFNLTVTDAVKHEYHRFWIIFSAIQCKPYCNISTGGMAVRLAACEDP
ncbi:Hypothetical predicted protein [Podarcis lilfordi]|uniref:Uncharacterized protein n=1 Tax=Podarcis lilfordi TaxID=74358 RepID=A0AA35PT18_9SAUR|nr:Hypothetical predicted protein [Podarcis lilfordi]